MIALLGPESKAFHRVLQVKSTAIMSINMHRKHSISHNIPVLCVNTVFERLFDQASCTS